MEEILAVTIAIIMITLVAKIIMIITFISNILAERRIKVSKGKC